MGYDGEFEGPGGRAGADGGRATPTSASTRASAPSSAARPHTSSSWARRAGGEWPYPGKPYWVIEHADLPVPDGADVRVTAAAVADLHEELAAAAGERNIWVVGGGGVASQFAEAGLLDEVLVTVVPVVLGEGKPLFDRALPGGPLRLTGTTVFDSGDGRAALRARLSAAAAPPRGRPGSRTASPRARVHSSRRSPSQPVPCTTRSRSCRQAITGSPDSSQGPAAPSA